MTATYLVIRSKNRIIIVLTNLDVLNVRLCFKHCEIDGRGKPRTTVVRRCSNVQPKCFPVPMDIRQCHYVLNNKHSSRGRNVAQIVGKFVPAISVNNAGSWRNLEPENFITNWIHDGIRTPLTTRFESMTLSPHASQYCCNNHKVFMAINVEWCLFAQQQERRKKSTCLKFVQSCHCRCRRLQAFP